MSTFETSADFISVETAAEALSVSTKTIRSHIKSGKLPAYEIGPKLIRINVLDLRAFCKPVVQSPVLVQGKTRSDMTAAARATLAFKQYDKRLRSKLEQEPVKTSETEADGGQNDLD